MGIVIRQSIKGVAVTYIGAFIGFLITFFLRAKFLTAEEVGLTSVLFEAASLLSGFALMGVTSSAIRFFPYFKSEDGKHNGFLFYLVAFPFVGSVIFILLYFLFREPITELFIKNSALFIDYFNWVPVLAIFLVYWMVFEIYSSLLMRIAVPKLIREVIVRILLVVVYLLYAFKIVNLDGLIACYISIYGIVMLMTFYYVSRIGTISFKHTFSFVDKPLRKQVLYFTSIWIVGSLGANILSRLDLFMVGSELGLAYAGIYSIAFYIVAVIEIPSRSIATISSPIASEALKQGELGKITELYRKVALHQLMVGGFVFLLIWINIDNIFALIPNGEVYMEGKWVVFFLAMTRLVEVTLNFGNILISFSRYYHWGLYFTFLIMAVGIVLNIWLIPILGVTGAAVATLITTLFTYGIHQWLVQAKIKANPFTINLMKLTGIFLLALGVNQLLPPCSIVLLDGVYRTVIISLVACSMIYFFHISTEVNLLVNNFLAKIYHRK